MHSIVIAGGRGSRLGSLSAVTPKALLKFGPYSLLEIQLNRLRRAGATRITLCTAHLGEMIEDEFGDGARIGVPVDYCRETSPLGTAGPLRLVADWTAPALVMNCDILTTLDFRALHEEHENSGATVTLATCHHEITVPFGVVDRADNHTVRAVREKPVLKMDVATGIYVLSPTVKSFIRDNGPTDMPELIQSLLIANHSVAAFPFDGLWHDVGTPQQYHEASLEFAARPELYVTPEMALTMGQSR